MKDESSKYERVLIETTFKFGTTHLERKNMEEKISLINELESMVTYALSKMESSDVFNFEDRDYWFFYSLDKQLEQISIDITAYHAAKSTQ